MAFAPSRDLFFFKLCYSKNSFRNTVKVLSSLDPDQAQYFAGLICVQTICKGYLQVTNVAPVGQELNTSKKTFRSLQSVVSYGKCSKISKTSSLPKKPRQTGQTQIRLLLKNCTHSGEIT